MDVWARGSGCVILSGYGINRIPCTHTSKHMCPKSAVRSWNSARTHNKLGICRWMWPKPGSVHVRRFDGSLLVDCLIRWLQLVLPPVACCCHLKFETHSWRRYRARFSRLPYAFSFASSYVRAHVLPFWGRAWCIRTHPVKWNWHTQPM